MTAISNRAWVAGTLVAALVLSAATAHAQVVGGGLGGFGGGANGQQIITWLIENLILAIIEGAVLFVGIKMMLGRHELMGVVAIIAGAIIISQHANITAMFPVG